MEGVSDPIDENGNAVASRPIIRLNVAFAAIITVLAFTLFVTIPYLIPLGGIPGAQTDFQTLSPIFFPRLTFALTAVFGFTFLISNIRRLPSAVPGKVYSDEGALVRVVTFYCVTLAYAFLLPLLGFVIPTILLLGGGAMFFGLRSWWQVLSFSLVLPVVIRFVFERLLAISLPVSAFEPIENSEEALMQFLTSLIH